MDVSLELNHQHNGGSKFTDDDGRRVKRTGNVWTASAHLITAVIGSGLLSLPWAIGQLGWIAGPVFMIFFSFVIYYTSSLLADCYRSGDPITGKRNYTYMDAVQAYLGGFKVKVCGWIQYLNLFGIAIGYIIDASISLKAIEKSNCFHKNGDNSPCPASSNMYKYMIIFGATEIIFSQIPHFDQIWWLSIVAAVMSFTYSSIGIALSIVKVIANGGVKGSLTGIGSVTQMKKIRQILEALGNIAFAYYYSVILIEIQDTIKSSESKVMKKATLISVGVTTLLYLLFGCTGYAAFGDLAHSSLLNSFRSFNPYWLLDIANAAIFIHLIGAYQVYCRPLFAFIEKWAIQQWPGSKFISRETTLIGSFKLNLFRLIWRSVFVIITTIIAMLLPFFNDVVGFLGAFAFWPLTVYFPIEMYIVQKKVEKWSTRWVCLQMLSLVCLVITIAAATGSIDCIITHVQGHKPFKTSY
ncbi:hypothetical protein J5N97_012309 [Dioscorea zingiberensis]|uniref:Amino acid transporter transmembrane domain-containing protein n=1 Tax=Dioscorea zingiberensis TaxID=325984 RepID=A0A9D5CNV1_9LILI|nr:hypothetical protein J5N97_012309 [Dioscorea zingiberensis]